MSGNRILGERDVNVTMTDAQPLAKDVKSMEYHRQVLQSRIAQEPSKQYISPSDTIMSPCTAKLSALRSKQVSKAKPKSLFAQASTKRFQGENPFGAQPTQSQSQSPLGTRKAPSDGVLTSRIR